MTKSPTETKTFFYNLQKLKKDLKTLKKQKESEAKRIMKELKSKEEELESCKGTIQIKEVAIESLNSIMKEQREKLQFVSDQLQEMKTALLQANKDAKCKTWYVTVVINMLLAYLRRPKKAILPLLNSLFKKNICTMEPY